MAKERIPNDPYRSGPSDGDFGRQAHPEDELRFDPEAPALISGAKVTMFAVAIALVLGAIFYGLNNTSVHHAQTAPPAQTTQGRSPVQAPPGMRDVTPHTNTNPGVTTGQAPSSAPVPPTAPDSNNK
jgi:hypothetical protein